MEKLEVLLNRTKYDEYQKKVYSIQENTFLNNDMVSKVLLDGVSLKVYFYDDKYCLMLDSYDGGDDDWDNVLNYIGDPKNNNLLKEKDLYTNYYLNTINKVDSNNYILSLNIIEDADQIGDLEVKQIIKTYENHDLDFQNKYIEIDESSITKKHGYYYITKLISSFDCFIYNGNQRFDFLLRYVEYLNIKFDDLFYITPFVNKNKRLHNSASKYTNLNITRDIKVFIYIEMIVSEKRVNSLELIDKCLKRISIIDRSLDFNKIIEKLKEIPVNDLDALQFKNIEEFIFESKSKKKKIHTII